MARPVGDVIDELLACACEALEEAGRPACRCFKTIGLPIGSFCCECESPGVTGDLTAHFEDLYPADANTLTRVTRIYPCREGVRAADVMLVLTRCYPRLNAAGQIPDADEVDQAADELHEDVEIVWRALNCCEPRLVWRGLSVDSDPEGGCSTLVARVTVEV